MRLWLITAILTQAHRELGKSPWTELLVVPDFCQARSSAAISMDSFHHKAHKGTFYLSLPLGCWCFSQCVSEGQTLSTDDPGSLQLSPTALLSTLPSKFIPAFTVPGIVLPQLCSFHKIYKTLTTSATGAKQGVLTHSSWVYRRHLIFNTADSSTQTPRTGVQ